MSGKRMLRKGVPNRTEWRWGNVVSVLPHLLPMEVTLRSTFRAVAFRQHPEGGPQDDAPNQARAGAADPARIERTVKDPY
eukprot:15484108-Alexandrium_andersonii.AAC.1